MYITIFSTLSLFDFCLFIQMISLWIANKREDFYSSEIRACYQNNLQSFVLTFKQNLPELNFSKDRSSKGSSLTIISSPSNGCTYENVEWQAKLVLGRLLPFEWTCKWIHVPNIKKSVSMVATGDVLVVSCKKLIDSTCWVSVFLARLMKKW